MCRRKRHRLVLILKRLLYGLIIIALIAILSHGPALSTNIVKVVNDIRIGRMSDFEPEIPDMVVSGWSPERAAKWLRCRSALEPCFRQQMDQETRQESGGSDEQPKTTAGIPRIIHQMYATNKIPRILAKYIRSWIRNHKSWSYMFWSNEDLDRFVRAKYPEYYSQYQSYTYNIQRSDMVRLLVLHYYGGVYVDLDYMSLKPLDKLLENRTCVLTHDPDIQGLILYHEHSIVTNAFLACAPRHPILQLTLQSLDNARKLTERARGKYLVRYDSRWTIYMTGPFLLSRVFDEYTSKTCCLREKEFHIELIHSDILNPLCDAEKLGFYKRQCKELKASDLPHLVLKRLKQECRLFRINGYRCIVGEEALARHDSLHIGYTNSHDQTGLVSVSSITQVTFLVGPFMAYDWTNYRAISGNHDWAINDSQHRRINGPTLANDRQIQGPSVARHIWAIDGQ